MNEKFASNVEITKQYHKICSKGSSGSNTVVPSKRDVACTLVQ